VACSARENILILGTFFLSVHQVTKVPEKLLSFAVRCKNLTVSNTRTVLLTPEIYISQNIYEQLLDLLLESFRGARRSCIGPVRPEYFFSFLTRFLLPHRLFLFSVKYSLCSFLCSQSHCVSEPEEVVEFVEEVIAGLLSDQEVRTFEEVIVPVFDIFQGRIKDLDLCQPLLYSYLDVILYFSHHKDIAKVRRHRDT